MCLRPFERLTRTSSVGDTKLAIHRFMLSWADLPMTHGRVKHQAQAAEAEEDRLQAEEYQALLRKEAAAREAALAATFARSAARAEQAGFGVQEAAKVQHSWPIVHCKHPKTNKCKRSMIMGVPS